MGGMNEADVKILIAEVTSGKVTSGSIIGEYEPRPLGVLSADSSTLSAGGSSAVPTGSVEAPDELTFGTCHAFRVRWRAWQNRPRLTVNSAPARWS